MPTSPRKLMEAIDKHPDFKLGLLKLLLEDARIADVWEWGVPGEFEDGSQPKFRRMTALGQPLVVVWCSIPAAEWHERFGGKGQEWTWLVFDPFHPKEVAWLAQATAPSAVVARERADNWLRGHDWTVPGTHLMTE